MRVSEIAGQPATWARRLTWTTVAGLALGVAGPFGSYAHADTLDRLAYWLGLSWTGALVLGVLIKPVLRWASRNGWPRGFAAAAATIVGCAPVAAIAASVGRHVWPLETGGLEPLHWYAQTLFVAAPLVAGVYWLERRLEEVRPIANKLDILAVKEAPLAFGPAPEDVPAWLRTQTLCLQMEDHYVRVHTSSGSELVLLPMRRAISALGDIEGLQVHRSWWVARSAVREVAIEGRTVALILSGGMRVPVARNRVAELRSEGWLKA